MFEIPSFLYEPYSIGLISAIIISLLSFIILRNQKSKKNKNQDNKDLEKTNKSFYSKLIIIFIASFVIITSSIYVYNYVNKNDLLKGGNTNDLNNVEIDIHPDNIEVKKSDKMKFDKPKKLLKHSDRLKFEDADIDTKFI